MTYRFHNRLERINIQAGTYQLADTEQEHVVLLAGQRNLVLAKTGGSRRGAGRCP